MYLPYPRRIRIDERGDLVVTLSGGRALAKQAPAARQDAARIPTARATRSGRMAASLPAAPR